MQWASASDDQSAQSGSPVATSRSTFVSMRNPSGGDSGEASLIVPTRQSHDLISGEGAPSRPAQVLDKPVGGIRTSRCGSLEHDHAVALDKVDLCLWHETVPLSYIQRDRHLALGCDSHRSIVILTSCGKTS